MTNTMPSKFLTLLLTTTATLGAAQDAPPPTAESFAREARDLAAQARQTSGAASIDRPLWRAAARAAEQAVALQPNNSEFLKLRADIYTDVSFWARAQNAWSAYFAAGGTDAAARKSAANVAYNLGFTAYSRGQLDVAARHFDSCVQYAPSARCFAWAGRVAFEGGESDRAASLYEQAVQADPQDRASAYFLDIARRTQTYGPQAAAAFSQGYRTFDAGDLAGAARLFRQAVMAAPEFTEAWRMLGRASLDLGRGADATEAYENVVRLEGPTDTNRYQLQYAREVHAYGLSAVQAFRDAYGKYAAGDRVAAEAGFRAATGANAGYRKAWAWLGRVQYETGDYAGATEAYRRAVQLDPNDQSSEHFLRLAEKQLAGE